MDKQKSNLIKIGIVLGSVIAFGLYLTANKKESIWFHSVGPGAIWDEDLATWVNLDSGHNVDIGIPIYITALWVNKAESGTVGHVNLTVDGVQIQAGAGQDIMKAHGEVQTVRFDGFLLSEGTHTCVLTLSSNGVVLDSGTFTLIANMYP